MMMVMRMIIIFIALSLCVVFDFYDNVFSKYGDD